MHGTACGAGLRSSLARLDESTHAGRLREAIEQLLVAAQSLFDCSGAGYPMARDRCDDVSAFNKLWGQARSRPRKVADLAAELLPGAHRSVS